MFVGDVGFGAREEISVVEPGLPVAIDHGWPILEGTRCIDPADCDTTGTTPPIHEYAHADGCAIVLGPVYGGCALPGHRGRLFFGDFCEGWVRSLRYSLGEVGSIHEHDALGLGSTLSGFGTDALGEVYLLAWEDGAIYKVVPAGD